MKNNIEMALKTLGKTIGGYHSIYLHKSDTDKVISRLQSMLVGYVNLTDADSIKDKKAMEIIEALVDVLQQQAKLNNNSFDSACMATQALERSGLFTPKSIYLLKEDLEALSQLHSKYKSETEQLIEEGQIALKRNAELRLKNEELKFELALLKAS